MGQVSIKRVAVELHKSSIVRVGPVRKCLTVYLCERLPFRRTLVHLHNFNVSELSREDGQCDRVGKQGKQDAGQRIVSRVSDTSRPRFPDLMTNGVSELQGSLVSTKHLARADDMASNNRTERTSLLNGDAPTGDRSEARESFGARMKRFLQRNGVYLIIILLLILVLVPLLVQTIRGSGKKHKHHDSHGEKPSDPHSNSTELCTSAACVLASANILRSLSPRYDIVLVFPF